MNYFPYYGNATPQSPFQDVKFVTTEEARGYMVMPNASALLIDRQNSIAIVKTADNLGQSVSQQYRFEKIEHKSTEASFVTIEQYNELLNKVNEIQKRLGGNE